MKKIGLFYAPEKGSTEKVARMIVDKLGRDNVDMILVDKNTVPELFGDFESLIFAISTVGRDAWDANYSKIGWDLFVPKLDNYDFQGKKVAIVGLGNHIMYADTFVDSMGVVAEAAMNSGAFIVGQVSAKEYEFNDSKALYGEEFIGLPIDEDNEDDLTDARLTSWLDRIKSQLAV